LRREIGQTVAMRLIISAIENGQQLTARCRPKPEVTIEESVAEKLPVAAEAEAQHAWSPARPS